MITKRKITKTKMIMKLKFKIKKGAGVLQQFFKQKLRNKQKTVENGTFLLITKDQMGKINYIVLKNL